MEKKNNNKEFEELTKSLEKLGKGLTSLQVEFGKTVSTVAAGLSTFSALNNIFEFNEVATSFKKFNEKIDYEFSFLNLVVNEGCTNTFTGIKKMSKDLSTVFKNKGLHGSLNEFSEHFKSFGSDIKKQTADIADSLKTTFASMWVSIKGFPSTMKTNISEAFTPLKTNPFAPLTKAATVFGAVTTKIFSVAALASVALFAAALAGIKAYYDKLMATNAEFKASVDKAWAGVKAAFQPAIDAFGELFACLVTGKETVSNENNAIAESFLTVITSVTDALSTAVSFIAEIVSGIAQFIKDIMFTTNEDTSGNTATTWQTITTAISDAWTVIKEVFSIAVDFLSGIWSLFGDDLIEVFANAWSTVGEILGEAVDIVESVMDIVIGIFTGNGEKIKEGLLALSSSSKPLALQASSKLISRTLGKSLCLPRIAKLFCSQAPCSILLEAASCTAQRLSEDDKLCIVPQAKGLSKPFA